MSYQLEKQNRWQAESLAAFRDKFAAKSNCEALDAIDALRAKVTALEGENDRLRESVLDAEHLCKWLLQSNISGCDRERVIREYGISFSLLIAARAQQPNPQDKCVCGHPHGPDGSCTVCVSCIYTPRTSPAQDKEQA